MKAFLAALSVLSAFNSALGAPVDADAEGLPPGKKCPLYYTGISARDSFAGFLDEVYTKRNLSAVRTYWNQYYTSHEPEDAYLNSNEQAIQELEALDWVHADLSYDFVKPPCGKRARRVPRIAKTTPVGIPV